MRKDCSNMDGVIENFDAVLASTPIGNRFDQDNFYPMDGMVENYEAVLADTPIGNRFDQDNFYPANGLGARLGAKIRKKARNTKLGKKIRTFKANRNNTNVDSAKTLAKSGVNSKVVATTSDEPVKIELGPKKPMSIGAKIGIGAGIALVLGIGAYFIIKNKNK
jgi:hypothetical protein